MDYKKYKDRFLRHLLSVPMIYIMVIPLVILHFFFELYNAICLPLYGISKINRSEYIRIDRHRLKYLNIIDKFNCAYCGYANGLLHYASAIASKTEQYWCSIKHEHKGETETFIEPEHHKEFFRYGDEAAFNNKYVK